MWFDILALISLLIIVALMRRLVNIFPSLVACMIRWKENINLQLSMKTRTDRDILSYVLFVPFCLVAFRFKMYYPGFMSSMTDSARLWATIGIATAYVLLRILCKILFRMKTTSRSAYSTATESIRTYFIILSLLLIVTGGILSVFDMPLNHIRTAMFWISGTIYTLFLLRKTQIFLSYCNFFVSFLYLCALEILPTGVLIASAVIF